ncbi:uncharacterized protein KY384_007867 [Bacidia gigantensis]|uniref:uncharacterized protein n=1 Tax=Bacidia gigantensis TaxID=2732470 RepID=UPI001D040569|nr:uncharacterized protein KY384_007867 [Bacidia gigantensis]KAG8527713.1 hypothetical protein KY384_007867 [Bacidia gigantensis]
MTAPRKVWPQYPTSTSAPSSTPPSSSTALPTLRTVAPSTPSTRLQNLVCIITGASSPLGIGRATAHQFVLAGARAIYICDFNAPQNLSSLQAELESLPSFLTIPSSPNASKTRRPEIHTRLFDAADEAAVKAVVNDAIERYGRLDVFFANAGIVGTHKLFTSISSSEFLSTLRTNVLSVFLAMKYAAPAMRLKSSHKTEPGGSIIATSSVAGLRSNAGSTDYSASKAAVLSLVQSTCYQLAGSGVRVNAILPGLIETGMTALVFEGARKRGTEAKVGQLNPMGRAGVADEVARVAMFLASAESSYVNGQGWAVDGGLSAGLPWVRGKLA